MSCACLRMQTFFEGLFNSNHASCLTTSSTKTTIQCPSGCRPNRTVCGGFGWWWSFWTNKATTSMSPVNCHVIPGFILFLAGAALAKGLHLPCTRSDRTGPLGSWRTSSPGQHQSKAGGGRKGSRRRRPRERARLGRWWPWRPDRGGKVRAAFGATKDHAAWVELHRALQHLDLTVPEGPLTDESKYYKDLTNGYHAGDKLRIGSKPVKEQL